MNQQKLINMFAQARRTGANPQMLAQQMLMSDPEARRIYQQVQNMAGGMSPRDFALQFAKQNGVDEKDFLEFAKQFGLN